MSTGQAIALTIAAGILVSVAIFFPVRVGFDFHRLRDSLQTTAGTETAEELASETQNVANGDQPKEKISTTSRMRAEQYVESATHDYYQGNFDEANRRLERAKNHNPGNYMAYRLSGQLAFEAGRYRQAYNNWARALQLPNQDQTLHRDLDVLRRLLRHGRSEIDRLRRHLFHQPDDSRAAARLAELESQFSGND